MMCISFLDFYQTYKSKFFNIYALLLVICFQIRNRTKLGGKKDSDSTSEDKRKLVNRKTNMYNYAKTPINKRLS
jgi:hypothetical protein